MDQVEDKVQQPLLEQTEEKKTKLPFCIFLLSNGAVGAGILTLTSAVGKVGWGMGLGLYLFFGIFAGFANMMLQKAFNYTQEKTYSGIAKSIWNGKFEIFVDLIQFLYSVGTCCGYAIIIANELYLSVSFITEGKVVPSSLEFLTHREWLLVIATLFVILPPSLMRKITALRYTSIVAISGILYITIVMLYRAVNTTGCGLAEVADYSCHVGTCVIEANAAVANYTGFEECSLFCEGCEPSPIKSTLRSIILDKNIFAVLPIFCFGHCSQVQFIPIVADMEKPTRKRVGIVVFFAYLLIFTLYVLNSFSGYYSFCGYSASNVLDSYPALDPLILVGRLIISFALCFTFPLYGYSVREVVIKTFHLQNTAYWKLALVTVIMVLSCMTVAIFFNDLSTVIGITGAIGGSSLMCIIPSIMFIRWTKISDCKNKWANYLAAGFYLTLGLVMAIVGTYVTLVH
ncbi:hypothetical protein WA171_000990 [Blastocystis sp. BT1]